MTKGSESLRGEPIIQYIGKIGIDINMPIPRIND